MEWAVFINSNYPIKEQLLQVMINNDWSDMYLTVGSYPAIKIWWEILRIDEWISVLSEEDTINFAKSLITEKQHEDLVKNKNLDFSFTFHERRFRGNISFQMWKYMVVLRLLTWVIPSIDNLWLPQIYKDMTKLWQWLILVTWPTWSWKSTTLASIINHINEHENKHIITIEDPVEYVHEHRKSIIEQKEVWKDVSDFYSALMWAMRQNPQVILLWEMRTKNEIQQWLTLAETWHLVFSSLHTRNAYQTISRIIDSFDWHEQIQVRLQLAESLIAVFSQRLLRKTDWTWLVLAKEILIKNSAISNLIRENELHQIPSSIQMWTKEWMQLLERDLIDLIVKWAITLDEWLKYANNPKFVRDWINS